uniref:S1 motif domain-containing protein n=1 Tax=Parastrongyloides trichosuri TaxID=131310 RepID=A0A0N4ZK64_PARTI
MAQASSVENDGQLAVTLFKTASHKTITISASIYNTAVASTKIYDEKISTLKDEDLFNDVIFKTPKRVNIPRKALSENRPPNFVNGKLTPRNLFDPSLQSKSASTKRKQVDGIDDDFVTPKRFRNTGAVTSNGYKNPRAVPNNTPSTTPNVKSAGKPRFEGNSSLLKPITEVILNEASTPRTVLNSICSINKHLDAESGYFVKIKDLLKDESKGKDIIGVISSIEIVDEKIVSMIIIDDSCYGVKGELEIQPLLGHKFIKSVKGKTIFVKDVEITLDDGKNLLKISPLRYRIDPQSFEAEDILNWYHREDTSLKDIKMI